MLTDFTPIGRYFFSIFTMLSHIREMFKNLDQIESHDLVIASFCRGMNLMLTDFTPNWVITSFCVVGQFSIFVHSHDRGMKPGSN